MNRKILEELDSLDLTHLLRKDHQ